MVVSADPGDDRELKAREAALGLLARREHSRHELHEKLRRKGHPEELLAAVLDGLEADDLLSDRRFAEAYAHTRREKGYGPLRIRAELRERGVGAAATDAGLEAAACDWAGLAEQVRRKRFGDAVPGEWKERARQLRFLRQRGFDTSALGALGGEE